MFGIMLTVVIVCFVAGLALAGLIGLGIFVHGFIKGLPEATRQGRQQGQELGARWNAAIDARRRARSTAAQ